MKKERIFRILRLMAGLLMILALVMQLAACNIGVDGKDGKDGVDGSNGVDGAPGAPGKDGEDGAPGEDGEDGADGKSAYELALEDGFEGTLHEWLLSLAVRGGNGADGEDGKDGEDGAPGKDGVGVANVHVGSDGSLIVTLTDGTLINAGKISTEDTQLGEPDEMGFTPVYEMVVKGEGDLNLRDYPGTGKVIGVIGEGETLLRIGVQRDADPDAAYSRFLYNGVECYAKSHYFSQKYNYAGKIPTINLPASITLCVGEQFWIVTDQILPQMDPGLTVSYSYSGSGERVYDGTAGFGITPSAAGTATLTVTVEVVDGGSLQTVCRSTVAVTVVEKRTDLAATGMILGDSRVSDGEMVNTLATKLPGVTLLGTRKTGSSTVPHEGRGGWSAKNYATDESVSVSGYTLTNPFYNPATRSFDFSYYMSNYYPDTYLDFVVIHLGPNDGYSEESVTYVEQMVSSIRAYGAEKGREVKVLIMTEYLSPEDGYYMVQSGNTNMALRRLRQTNYFGIQQDAFGNREEEGVYLLPNFLCIDSWTDWSRETVETVRGPEEKIVDTIHLGTRGYRKEASVVATYLFSFF